MNQKLLNIGAVLLVLLGIGLLLYPTISNWLAKQYQSTTIQEYDQEVAKMNARLIEEELEKVRKYNDALSGTKIEDPFIPGSGMVLPDNYTSILNFTDNGVIGYIEIPEINVNLPIYHGVSDEVLRRGIGHMENTAFPIGGEGNHPVLTGHTGLNQAKLFTDLEKLVLEDIFYIKILNQTFAYQVDQIIVVEPDKTEELFPAKGKDYVTLVTCTPYAINSHRLLVRGKRISYVEEAEPVDAIPTEINWRLVMIVAFVIIVTISYAIYKYVEKRKSKKESLETGETNND